MKHLVLTIFFLLFNTAVTRADTTESYLVYNIYDEDSQCQTLFSSQESTYEQRPANIDVSPISFVFAEREFGYEPFTAQHFSSMGPVRFSILNNNPVPVYEVRVSVSSPTFEIHRGLSAQTANWPGSHPNNPEGDGITELPSAIYPPSQRSRNVQVRPIVGLLPGEHNAYLEIRGVVDGENVAVNVPISFTVTGEAPFIPDPEPEPEEPVQTPEPTEPEPEEPAQPPGSGDSVQPPGSGGSTQPPVSEDSAQPPGAGDSVQPPNLPTVPIPTPPEAQPSLPATYYTMPSPTAPSVVQWSIPYASSSSREADVRRTTANTRTTVTQAQIRTAQDTPRRSHPFWLWLLNLLTRINEELSYGTQRY